MASPVIQHLGDMDNLPRRLGAAEDKVVVLGPVVILIKLSHFLHQIPVHREQMADVVGAGEKVRIKIRLEMRLKESSSLHVQLGLVRIDHVV